MLELRAQFDEKEIERLRKLPANITAHVLPKALRQASRKVKSVMERELPDSDTTGTRKGQTAAARARWPYKLNKQVVVQVRDYEFGVLAITGPHSTRGAVVHIDFGEKARTTGRKHVLWGRYDETRQKPPLHRIQTLDVLAKVDSEVREDAERNILHEINNFLEKEFK